MAKSSSSSFFFAWVLLFGLMALVMGCTLLRKKKSPFVLPVGVAILIINKENQILMIKRRRADWDTFYGVLAEGLKPHECLRFATCRCAYEEAGIRVKEEDLKFLQVAHYKSEPDSCEAHIMFFFVCYTWEGTPYNRLPEKHSDLRWFDIGQVPSALAPHERDVIEMYKKHKAKLDDINRGYIEYDYNDEEDRHGNS